jgi:hypothetical protein
LPGGCNNSSNNVGINSTPVIDIPSNTLYAITFVSTSGSPTHYIHAIDLSTLTDQLPPVGEWQVVRVRLCRSAAEICVS